MKLFLVYIIIPLIVLFSPLLFFGKVFLATDAIDYLYPMAYFFKHHYLSMWNPLMFLGFPVISSFHYAFFSPVYHVVYNFFGYIAGTHFILFADVVLGGFLTYLFVKDLGLGMYERLTAAVMYTLSQFSVFWIISLTVTNSLLILPGLFYSVYRLVALRRKRYAFLLAFFIGLGFLTSHYQFVIMGLCAAGIFYLYLLYENYKKGATGKSLILTLFLGTLACLGGLLLAFPQIYETAKFFPTLWRSTAFSYSYISLIDFGKYFIPHLNLSHFNSGEFLPGIGIIGLILTVLGLMYCLKKEKYVLFFAVVAALSISFVIPYSPTAWILQQLPIFKYISQPARWMYVANLSTAILAAYGLRELIMRMQDVEWKLKAEKLFSYIFAAYIAVIGIASIVNYVFGGYIIGAAQRYFETTMFSSKSNGLPLSYYHDLISVLFHKNLGNLSIVNLQILVLLLSLAVFILILKKYHHKSYVSALITALLVVNLLLSGLFSLSLGDKRIITQVPQTAAYIKSRENAESKYRVLSFQVPFAQYQKILSTRPELQKEGVVFAVEGLSSNMNVLYEIPTVGGVDANSNRRAFRILSDLEGAHDSASLGDKLQALIGKDNLLDAASVKYILTPYQLGTSSELSLLQTFVTTSFSIPLYLYENRYFRPLLFAPSKVVFLPSEAEEKSFEILKERGDAKNTAVIECDECLSKASEQSLTMPGEITLVEYEDGLVRFRSASKEVQWVVLGETNAPGWQATIDNKETKIFFADHAFMGIEIPAGNHDVVFKFKAL